MNLKGRVALVTGGSKGIGKAIALKLAGNGAKVAVASRSGQEIDSNIRSYKADVSQKQQAQQLIENVISQWGKLDILVNNAGIAKDGLALRMSEEDFDEVLNVNLKSVFNCSQAAAKHMIKNGGGNIVNISSVTGLHGNIGQANYSASKAGIIGLTKTLAKELAKRNIRVNAIAPGFIETEMTQPLNQKIKEAVKAQIPLQRFGTAEEVSELVNFLASGLSSYVTGQVFVIDGGLFI